MGSPRGGQATLECYTEAYPDSINYWVKDNFTLSRSDKYVTNVTQVQGNKYKKYMSLVIRDVSPSDFISYQCVAKNSLGGTEGNIRLSGASASEYVKI